jgi:hypothetical protein
VPPGKIGEVLFDWRISRREPIHSITCENKARITRPNSEVVNFWTSGFCIAICSVQIHRVGQNFNRCDTTALDDGDRPPATERTPSNRVIVSYRTSEADTDAAPALNATRECGRVVGWVTRRRGPDQSSRGQPRWWCSLPDSLPGPDDPGAGPCGRSNRHRTVPSGFMSRVRTDCVAPDC